MMRAIHQGTRIDCAALLRVSVLLLLIAGQSGCTTAVRMSNNLDVATLVDRPDPTPPDDYFLWTAQPVTSLSEPRAGGGAGAWFRRQSWAHVRPKPVFLTDPDVRRPVLYAYTSPLTTSPPARLRGGTEIRLDGYGRVFVGLSAVDGSRPGGFLGGLVIDIPTIASSSGTIYATQSFDSERIQDIFPLPSAGTIDPYSPGTVIEMRWEIDQRDRSLSLMSGSPAVVTTYPAASDGVSNSPLQKLMVSVWLQSVGPGTHLFVDSFYVEEFECAQWPSWLCF